jgi:hypothetical protein
MNNVSAPADPGTDFEAPILVPPNTEKSDS